MYLRKQPMRYCRIVNIIVLHYVRLLHTTLLFTLKYFFIVSTSFSASFVIQGSFLNIWYKIQTLV